MIRTTVAQTPTDITQRYTFFSHVGNALALWRKTHPADFWMKWEADHPGWYNQPADALSIRN